jgi:hypothetical protein
MLLRRGGLISTPPRLQALVDQYMAILGWREERESWKTNQGMMSNLATAGCKMLYKSRVIKIKGKKSDFGGF